MEKAMTDEAETLNQAAIEKLRRASALVERLERMRDAWPPTRVGKDVITEAATALRAREWQPIETAPKDEPVLIYIEGAGEGLEYEIAHCSSDDPDDWYSSVHLGQPIDMPPTHWMALPKAPEQP